MEKKSTARFVGMHELAEHLGLTISWIKKQAKAGRLPFVKDGNHMRFPVPEAEEAAVRIATGENTNARNAEPLAGDLVPLLQYCESQAARPHLQEDGRAKKYEVWAGTLRAVIGNQQPLVPDGLEEIPGYPEFTDQRCKHLTGRAVKALRQSGSRFLNEITRERLEDLSGVGEVTIRELTSWRSSILTGQKSTLGPSE